jgi:limonene-1,2-epoxide hydrolase
MSLTPEEVVRAFLAGSGSSLEGDLKNYRKWLAEDVWYFSGIRLTETLDKVCEYVRSGVEIYGCEAYKVELLNIASSGSTVLVERRDSIYLPSGALLVVLPIMGRFEVKNERIAVWCDYYNPAPLIEAFSKVRRQEQPPGRGAASQSS